MCLKGGALDSFFLLSLFDAFALCAPVGKVMLRVQLPEASSQRLMLRYGFTPFAYTMNRESLSVCFVFSPSVYLYIGEEKRGTWCGWTKEITKRINTRRRRFGRGKGGWQQQKGRRIITVLGGGNLKKGPRTRNERWNAQKVKKEKRRENPLLLLLSSIMCRRRPKVLCDYLLVGAGRGGTVEQVIRYR